MRITRFFLAALGLAGLGVGIVSLIQMLRFDQIVNLTIWLACAVALHDGILVPLSTGLASALNRAGTGLSRGSVVLVECGFVVGAVLTLAVAPELYVQSRGPGNPTILTGDYALHLAWVWAVIVVLVAVGTVMLSLRAAHGGSFSAARIRRTFALRGSTRARR